MREFKATAVPLVSAQAELGESPLWDVNAGLRWLDIKGQQLFTLNTRGECTSVTLSETVTAIGLGHSSALLAVTSTGFGWLEPRSGCVKPITDVVDGDVVAMNDGSVDAAGRCWAGSAVRDGSWTGALYRLVGDRVSKHAEELDMSNGIDWSPAADVLYHVDSTAGTLKAWDYDLEIGRLGRSRVLRTVPSEVGLPDGLTVDVEGSIWLAVWGAGAVWRLDGATGRTTAVVHVPTPYTTSCAFGGSSLSTLYITTANPQFSVEGGLLYSVDVESTGRKPNRFAGASL